MKCLSVPVNAVTIERLEYDECMDDDLIEVFLDESDYKKLWDTGVLTLINEKLGKNIDDYEDEGIIGLNDLYQAQAITKETILFNPGDDILNKLLSQINLAIKFNTGIFFFF
ncbi:hypothetical protein GCM10011513_37320 [Franconibacter daqui]|uniref:hypothetical protein n=1 Tax=Franconibacter daqui TaxID=2047724 RepID=UPI00166DE2A9|nr:hypothetical protein [Franconibacter daqui]GGD36041.1 hypothetical protein GCM10011513_37320 [Franconibacter daqui]